MTLPAKNSSRSKKQAKILAITGAAGYLMSEIARNLAVRNWKIALLDRDARDLGPIVCDIRKAGGEGEAFSVDVTKKEHYQIALRGIIEKWGRLDAAVLGAGINAPTPFLKISVEEWNQILAVQLTGTMLGCQVFGAQMLKQRKGSIVTISSASSGPPLSRAFTYSVAKAGVKNLTQNLAREWGDKGVRVNALRPGFFPTEWSKKHFIDQARAKAILAHTPMGRYGQPKELVGAVAWLLSDEASFVTGAEIAVDGGFTCMTI